MKKGLSTIALVFSLVLGNTGAFAQAGLKNADKGYDRWAYIDAIKLYEKVVDRGYSSQELVEKLGNAYYFNARYAEAERYYQKLFTEYESANIPVEYFYRYANTLQNVGNETEAKRYYNQFVEKVGAQTQIAQFRQDEAELRQQIQLNSGRYGNITNLAINTPYADYGTFVKDETFFYTSARDTGNFAKKRHKWTGESFTSLYHANVNEVEENNDVQAIKGKVKSRLNESSAIITNDGQTMYFTRNNIAKGKRRYDADKNTKLKIFRAELVDGDWANVTELPFNSDQFNTAHPALSQDEKTLYFSSDRPGGFGEADLWKVSINGENYGTPENLGAEINTEARETFPFVVGNELYFSSNGRVGLGGLDVFAVQIRADKFGEVQNVGAPINSEYDDFAYYIDKETQKGFFSSNREGGKGNDDIYSFSELRPLALDCNQELHVKVIDAKTGALITDATVTLADELYNVDGISKQYVDPTYDFNHAYECGDVYHIKAEREGYITQEIEVTLPNQSGLTEKIIALEPEKLQLKEGDDLFKVLNLNPIYFDLDKDNIRPDAALELAKVFAVMEEYPNMKVDVRSHTDSRASFKYNEDLSERRAKSTAEWLIANGINRNRLTWKGYGETQLINGCADGVDCSEAEHQMNRRSEFIIVEM